MFNPEFPSRRNLLQTALAVPASAAMLPAATSDLIRKENSKSGADWQLTNVKLDGRNQFRTRLIEGYCSRQSIEAGETMQIMVSTNPPGKFEIEIFRMGYYGGRGARRVAQLGPFEGKTQPEPPIAARRLRECRWEPATEVKIPAEWASGGYLGRLARLPERGKTHAWQSYIVFIVRDSRRADILFQCSDNTWQAYNRWPHNYSMYTDPRHAWAPDVAASFDRPYGKYAQIFDHPLSIGSGEFLLWEFPLCYWLESRGDDVTYCSNADMIDPAQPLRSKDFLSIGPDEYWDLRQD